LSTHRISPDAAASRRTSFPVAAALPEMYPISQASDIILGQLLSSPTGFCAIHSPQDFDPITDTASEEFEYSASIIAMMSFMAGRSKDD